MLNIILATLTLVIGLGFSTSTKAAVTLFDLDLNISDDRMAYIFVLIYTLLIPIYLSLKYLQTNSLDSVNFV